MSFPPPFYRWRPHPWHGLEVGPDPPAVLTAFIEITPIDVIKYEVDKQTGYTKVDRPQQGSSSPPVLYGFIPRTYCDRRVAELRPEADRGDGDPLDICVFSERPIDRAEVLLRCRAIGGLAMIDNGEADDKIVAVLDGDPFWDGVDDIGQMPAPSIDRLEHYFLTYKVMPGAPETGVVDIVERYGRDHAFDVIRASMADYEDGFGE